MDTKRRAKPTDVCQYGKNCFRQNPHHFMEYAHEHLENIIEQNTTNQLEQYKIPDEFFSHKDLILDQIRIINGLFPKLSSKQTDGEPFAKGNKPDEKPSHPIGSWNMEQKLDAAKPYNYFLTTITSSPSTHNEPLSITFQDILDPSLGELECSVQINFMVEMNWLLRQYDSAGLFVGDTDNFIFMCQFEVFVHTISTDQFFFISRMPK